MAAPETNKVFLKTMLFDKLGRIGLIPMSATFTLQGCIYVANHSKL
jgi:hypothetical protein